MTTVRLEMPPEILAELRGLREELQEIRERLGEEPQFYNVRQAAKALNVSEDTIRKWGREGRLRVAKRAGRKMLFDREELLSREA